MNKFKIVKILIIAAGIIASAVFYTKNNSINVNNDQSLLSFSLDEKTELELSTLIRKAVHDELVSMAKQSGGVTDEESIPESGGVTDEESIPEKALETAESEAAEIAKEHEGMVNINTAGKEELMTLKGIGEAKAEAIISYREKCGDFMYIEEIMNISGIKESAFTKIKDSIYV